VESSSKAKMLQLDLGGAINQSPGGRGLGQ